MTKIPTEAEIRARARQLRDQGAGPHAAAQQARREAWEASTAADEENELPPTR
ncbi:hypothetical protein [Frankia sp. Cas3]|uniref:hypothetical protein n=1 Tax=Frankia sp. Cas3 TaxID=3073926 RepID=UPI002AD2BF9F|nr:hypothetical protein [Frankia sp. Cas3]